MPEWFALHSAWTALGILGGIVFYGRFYVQWLVSERQKKSVIPIAFWYMSSAGSLMLFAYAVYLRSPVGALGQCFNIVVYSRNLVHIWREQGRLTRGLNIGVHAAAGLIATSAMVLMLLTWQREYAASQDLETSNAVQNWLWLAAGAAGQALFAARFLIQWLATELKKKSVVPTAFWYFSIAAATLQAACFVQRKEWVFAVGMAATLIIYGRNLMLIYAERRAGVQEEG